MAMTFLATFYDGTPTIVDAGGAVAHTATGVTYTTAPSFTGQQAVVVDSTDVLETTEVGADLLAQVPPDAGSIAIRFRNDTAVGATTQCLVSVGNQNAGTSTGDSMMLSLEAAQAGKMQMFWRSNSSTVPTVLSAAAPTVGAAHFAYGGWNGTSMRIQLDDAALVVGSRNAVVSSYTTNGIGIGMRASTNAMQLGGIVEAVAAFDAELTDAERAFLRDTTTPWTFGMALAEPVYGSFLVLRKAGTDTSAPVLTLP